jgi:hypothetical protein
MSWVVAAITGATIATIGTTIYQTSVQDDVAGDQQDAAKTAADIAAQAATDAANIQATAATDAAKIQAQAAADAAKVQADTAAQAIAEQQRQFGAMQDIMRPWVEQGTAQMAGLDQYQAAGSDALKQQRAMMGLDGYDAQRAAISGISGGAEMEAMALQGENAMMQSGAATGGLRGGNMQGALAQYRPSMLSNLINQQYSKLGGLIDMGQGITMNRAALGQASAAGVGAAGMQSASSIGNILTNSGNAQAGGIIGAGNAYANGVAGAGNANAGGTLGAGQAWANGLLGGANAQAQSDLAQAQAWGSLPSQLLQLGLMGYGVSKW